MTLILLLVGGTIWHMDFGLSFYWLDYETLNFETYAYWLNYEILNFGSLNHWTLHSLPSTEHWITELWISVFLVDNESLNLNFCLLAEQWIPELEFLPSGRTMNNEHWTLNFCLLTEQWVIEPEFLPSGRRWIIELEFLPSGRTIKFLNLTFCLLADNKHWTLNFPCKLR